MPILNKPLPLSLYIHLPWCIKKCPYCDFNSHELKKSLPEKEYIHALLTELDDYLPLIGNRNIISIFFGGGTPSLFSAEWLAYLLTQLANKISFAADIEITLEANPGAIEQNKFKGFRAAGINRISLGVQSLQDDKLKSLGRIHDKSAAINAINALKQSGIDNFNIDLMYGLPHQTLDDAMLDLQTALQFEPQHLSWYQLTLEPQTFFYRHPPPLPHDETIWEMYEKGITLLHDAGLTQYEVSAYAADKRECRHNRNYWEFGDYLGLGAGAHSKLTDTTTGEVLRFTQVKHPKDYINDDRRNAAKLILQKKDLIFEFMLNALRLTTGIPTSLFTERTGLEIDDVLKLLSLAQDKKLLMIDEEKIVPSTLGKRFLNDLVAMFL